MTVATKNLENRRKKRDGTERDGTEWTFLGNGTSVNGTERKGTERNACLDCSVSGERVTERHGTCFRPVPREAEPNQAERNGTRIKYERGLNI